MGRMTSLASIFGCAAADVTISRVQQLVDQGMPESLTLEYKARFSKGLVDSVAAMANSYGGVILVGVTDQRSLVGVGEDTVVQIVNTCHESLEPPWQPEIIPLPLTDAEGKFILVIRIDASRAPRPVLLKGAAPVRLHGRNAVADRGRLARLFSESGAVTSGMRRVPQLVGPPCGTQAEYDFALRSGLIMTVNDAAAWRPLSDRGIDSLATALDGSPIGSVLLGWCDRLGVTGVNTFSRSGLNRSRIARLVWQAVVDGPVRHPAEAIVNVTLPDSYGLPSSGLTVTLDVIVRARPLLAAFADAPPPSWRLPVSELYELCDGMLAGLTDSMVTAQLAELAGIDPVLVPQPATLDFVTATDVSELINMQGLTAIPDAGASRGANLSADPAIDLRDSDDRRAQVNSWMQQIALDAGLRGMERVLDAYHRDRIVG